MVVWSEPPRPSLHALRYARKGRACSNVLLRLEWFFCFRRNNLHFYYKQLNNEEEMRWTVSRLALVSCTELSVRATKQRSLFLSLFTGLQKTPQNQKKSTRSVGFRTWFLPLTRSDRCALPLPWTFSKTIYIRCNFCICRFTHGKRKGISFPRTSSNTLSPGTFPDIYNIPGTVC